MTDNPDPVAKPDNPDPITPDPKPDPQPTAFAWKEHLGPDIANSPTMKKFPDTKEGLVQTATSYLELQKLLGHDKVPVPKGKDDTAAWNLFEAAFGIPSKADGYNLPDANVPDSMKALSFDKAQFAEVMHKHKVTPDAAGGLWEAYTELSKQTYANALKNNQENLTQVINQMRSEWGDAFESKIELGQMVINKFSANQEESDFITAALSKDPRGQKFLAKVGDQFAENKIGDFKYTRHSLTPEEAQQEMSSIRMDPSHPYNNGKSSQKERDKAIDYFNSLIAATQSTARKA